MSKRMRAYSGKGRAAVLALACAAGGCATGPEQHATRWGTLPKASAGAYALSSASADAPMVAELRSCLADIGLRPGADPRFLLDVAYSVAPGRVSIADAARDEPQPIVTTGRPSVHGASKETLTLVMTDIAGKRSLYRAQLVRRQPTGTHAHGPSLPALLCQAIRQDHPASS